MAEDSLPPLKPHEMSEEERYFRQTHREEIAAARSDILEKRRNFRTLMGDYIFRTQNALDAETLAMHDIAIAARWIEHAMDTPQAIPANKVRELLEDAITPNTVSLSRQEKSFRTQHFNDIRTRREELIGSRDYVTRKMFVTTDSEPALTVELLARKDVADAVRMLERPKSESMAQALKKFLELAIDPKTNALPERNGWQLRQLARQVVRSIDSGRSGR